MQKGRGYKQIFTENKVAGSSLGGARGARERLVTNGMDPARKAGAAGAPTVRTGEVADKVRALYEDTHDVSIGGVTASTGPTRSSTRRALKRNLGLCERLALRLR